MVSKKQVSVDLTKFDLLSDQWMIKILKITTIKLFQKN